MTEIDLLKLLLVFKKKWWMIFLSGLLGLILMLIIDTFLITPVYQSKALIYVQPKATAINSLSDIEIGSQLANDYKVIIKSRPVLEDVIQKIGLDISHDQLKNKIDIENPVNTRILILTVTDENPVSAQGIVNQIAYSSSKYIGELMEMTPPKIIEFGVVSKEKAGPNIKKHAALGALFGVIIMCAILVAMDIFDDSIRNEEDVEHYLGLNVLAGLPDNKRDNEKRVRNKHEK